MLTGQIFLVAKEIKKEQPGTKVMILPGAPGTIIANGTKCKMYTMFQYLKGPKATAKAILADTAAGTA